MLLKSLDQTPALIARALGASRKIHLYSVGIGLAIPQLLNRAKWFRPQSGLPMIWRVTFGLLRKFVKLFCSVPGGYVKYNSCSKYQGSDNVLVGYVGAH